MGNSGSGKSTLIYALSGMDRPTIGTITYYMVCGLLKHKDRKALAAKAKSLLSRVEIGESDYNKFPSQMSGGLDYYNDRGFVTELLLRKV